MFYNYKIKKISYFCFLVLLFFLLTSCNKVSDEEIVSINNLKTIEIENNKQSKSNLDTQEDDYIDPRDPRYQYEIENNIIEPSKEDERLLESLQDVDDIEEIEYFHYQLQDTNIDDLKDLDAEYIIIDIDDSEFHSNDIKKLRDSDKVVLSYLSIGEAEDYRSYWEDNWKVSDPSFIYEENPDWEGNYRVLYWDEQWQNIIIKQLDKIIDLGYDGVYLDTIDTYEYFMQMNSLNTRQEMINFVKDISDHAKSRDSDFLIITQNALELYYDYSDDIDGVARESLWYSDNDRQDLEDTSYSLEILKDVDKDNNIILVIDYPTSNSKVCNFYDKCSDKDFICTVSNRELNLDKPIECKQ